MLGERYAKENGFKTEIYPVEWEKYNKKAGPKRNKQMAEIGDFFICFWHGKSKGRKSLIDFVTKLNKPLKIKRI